MPGRYVHALDPVVVDLGGLYLWWYGLGFALGFLHIFLFLRHHRARLTLTLRDVYTLTLLVMVSVLMGGRLIEVAFDEWSFYREHPWLIPAYWLGGMATHGLLLGAGVGAGLFAWISKKSFLLLADALVVPGAVLMGLGRLGNFIDGQIVGSVTDGWWGVKFPDAEGFRHPVVLYDGVKNLLLAVFLVRVHARHSTPGAVAARFVFWYAFPRIFIDLLRDYPTHRLALGTGQTLNLLMTIVGIVLLVRSRLRRLGRLGSPSRPARGPHVERPPLPIQRVAFAALLLGCLTIPSNWTQDIPARYGKRHSGLRHSLIYPVIDTTPR